jgi:hypothetical protein
MREIVNRPEFPEKSHRGTQIAARSKATARKHLAVWNLGRAQRQRWGLDELAQIASA